MTARKCKVCVSQVSPHELKCVFCKNLFHIKCVKLSISDAAFINEDNNIHWFCDDCNIFTRSDFLCSLLAKVNTIEKSVKQIDGNLSVLMSNIPPIKTTVPSLETPAGGTRSKTSSKKRKGTQDIALEVTATKKTSQREITSNVGDDAHNKTFRDALLGHSSGNQDIEMIESIADENNEVPIPSVIEERSWIFVSRLNPTTSADNLSSWLKSKLNSDDVLCFPLIPRGVPLTELKMISFKIGVPRSMLDKAKNRKNWPSGILIRDFVIRAVSIPTIEICEQNLS